MKLLHFTPQITPIASFFLESPNLVDKITRSYIKIQDLFAKIGGMINALIIITKLLTFHYIRFNYLINLIDLTKAEDSIKENSNKIKDKLLDAVSAKSDAKINNFVKINNNKPAKNIDEKDLSKGGLNNLKHSFSFHEKNTEMSYFKYVWYNICCNIKEKNIYKQLTLIQKKLI